MSKLANLKRAMARKREESNAVKSHAISLLAGTATGALIGWLRGKYADSSGNWHVSQQIKVDVEPLLGGALGLAGILGWAGKYDEEAVTAGTAALAVYASNTVEAQTRKR
jgi:F0F1-type ATP synthase assembly protein I